MGFFSWKTSDTDKNIWNKYTKLGARPSPVYLITEDGRSWKEDDYDGYGVFGGQDIYELIAELNGKEGRETGIDINFDKNPSGEFSESVKLGYKMPKLVQHLPSADNWKKSWERLAYPETSENQGYFNWAKGGKAGKSVNGMMKKSIKKTMRKGIIADNYHSNRPSPSDSATKHPKGFKMKGNDGDMYVIDVTSAGIHRWVKVQKVKAYVIILSDDKKDITLYERLAKRHNGVYEGKKISPEWRVIYAAQTKSKEFGDDKDDAKRFLDQVVREWRKSYNRKEYDINDKPFMFNDVQLKLEFTFPSRKEAELFKEEISLRDLSPTEVYKNGGKH